MKLFQNKILIYLSSLFYLYEQKMRTIKFRGKSLSTGEWVYGVPVCSTNDRCYMIHGATEDAVNTHNEVDFIYTEVDPTTVGQYIGRKDAKGTEIYTDDLFIYEEYWDGQYIAIMQFSEDFHDDPSFHAVDLDDRNEYVDIEGLEVFSNIHDNPELLNSPDHEN